MRLIEYISQMIANSKYFQAIYGAQQEEIDKVNADIEDLKNQCFIDTATWGLVIWEAIYDIKTDESKPLDWRRSVVKAKRRGAATVTIEQLKNIVGAFLNGQVEVVENYDIGSIDITFTDYEGVPPNRDDLTETLRELMPAHLEINYILYYLIWDDLDKKNWSWDELDALNLTWDQLEVYK